MNCRIARALRIALLSLLIASILASSALAATSISVTIAAKKKIYEKASKSAKSYTLTKTYKAKMTDYSNDWARVTYDNKAAYVPLEDVNLVDPVKMYTSCRTSYYKKAGSDKQGTIDAGTIVYMIGLDGKYARIRKTKSGSDIYYVRYDDLTKNKVSKSDGNDPDIGLGNHGEYISASGSTTAMPASLKSTTTSAKKSKIEYTIFVAQNLLGVPFSDSAKPPKSFDISGFTRWCYNKAKSGRVKGSCKTQGYDSRFTIIRSISDLQRGDLVCFDTIIDEDSSDCVGIYLGDGKFIHASSTAKMVIISQLNSGYYNRTFSWGRRIFNS